jgi:aflatoxin B1 aldehyde reductase
VIYNPLAGGFFSGKYKTADAVPAEGRFGTNASTMGQMYRDRYFKPEIFKCLELIEPVARKHGLTLLEVALRWVRHHSMLEMEDDGGVRRRERDGVIIGVSSLGQLEGNLRDLEKGPLPEEVVEALDKAWMVSKASTPTYWR